MNKRLSLLEIVLIPLAFANLVSIIYLQPKDNSAIAAPNTEVTQSAGNKCQCPKTPRRGN